MADGTENEHLPPSEPIKSKQEGLHSRDKEWVFVKAEVAELADRYIDLIFYLNELNHSLETAENPLESCLDSLVAVKRFLEMDPIIAQSGTVRPLNILATTIRDVTLGGKPKFLRATLKTKNRPKSLSGIISLQATAAACAEVLIHYGMPVEDACKYVLRELEKENQINTSDSKFVNWTTVKRWRDEMGSRNPPESLKIYKGIETGLKSALGPNATLKATMQTIPHCILALKHSGGVAP